ncbi:MAG TPA: lytic transglycosylase domain-containing protein [Stellaceae bacterium]|nr:lytic transglycosylase domain-containing protein [Stellaceae bacterium]
MPFPLIRAAGLALGLLVPALAALAAEPSDADGRLYHSALSLARAGDLAAAEREAAQSRDPTLADAVEWVSLMRGSGGFAEIAVFLAKHPDWPGQVKLQARAEAATNEASDTTLLAWFAAHPPITIAGKLREAQLWLDHGRRADGLGLVRDVWANADFDRQEEREFLKRYRGLLREADYVARLDRLVWDGSTVAARRDEALVPPEYRTLAEARIALAAEEPGAERLMSRVPAELQHDPGLLYERIRWRRRKQHYGDAIALLDGAPPEQSHAEAWAVEREVLARFALAAGQRGVAYRIAAGHGPVTGAHFAELEFLAGWIALRFERRPEVAYDHFARLYDAVKLPISRARGAYWTAEAAEAMGRAPLANSWYGTAAQFITTYYGQLAAAHIGAADGARIDEPNPTPAQAAAFNRRSIVRVTRAFAAIGADDYVRLFVRALSDDAQTPDDHALIARLASDIGRFDLAIAAAKRASYAGVTLLAEGYPLEELPPGGSVEHPLILAMTRQESAFDVAAVSTAGARGLMQLMPATAKLVARSLQIPFSQSRLTGDVHYNLTLGRAYLSEMLGDFAGSYVLAVAAYNAGPARVHDWIQDFGDPRSRNVNAIDWIESIPVAETRNYVQRVLENLQVYRFRTGDRRLAFSLVSDLRR